MKQKLTSIILFILPFLSLGAERPNIVFILADDLGIGDVQTYGGDHCLIDTPNIDKLAKGGLKFTNAYVNASVCGPTRVAIMTGRYPWRFDRYQRGGAWGLIGLRFNPANHFTLGDLFQNAGYKAGYIGKWHLGTLMTTKDGEIQGETNVDYSQPLKIGPKQFGFDYSFILPGSLDMYPYAFALNNVWQGDISAQKGWSAFNRVGDAEKDFEDHEVLETFYGQAEAYIAKQTKNDPFFLYLALTAPHTPTSPGVNFRGKSALGVYGDFVMEVDHAVERVVQALKETGHYENTLILFSSDHGPATYAGNILAATYNQIKDYEARGHHSNGPHRGYKFSVYEGGLHVPLIAHWPKGVKAGTQTDDLVGLNDLMATFSELTGSSIQDTDAPDSVSFASTLRNQNSGTKRQHIILQSSMESFVIRDGYWKLCLAPGSGARGIYGNTPVPENAWAEALNEFGEQPTREDFLKAPFVQLFNLSKDPHEDNNLASQHPARVEKMVTILQDQIKRGRSTPGPDLENDKKVLIHQRLPGPIRDQL